jgi:hypothetical protein
MNLSMSSFVWIACAATLAAQSPLFVAKPAWPYMPGLPLLVDLDKDSSPEIVECHQLLSSQPGVTLSYRRLLGNGEWSQGPSFSSASFANATYHGPRAAGDVNGDGNMDIYVYRTVTIFGLLGVQPWFDQLWLGDGLGGLTEASQNLPNVRTNVTDAEFADFDGDGDLDLVLCDVSGLLLWMNDGTGVFRDESSRRIQNHTSYVPWRCAVLDADQDGDLDILVSNGFGAFQPTILYANAGRAVFTAHSQGVVRIADFYVLDADHDGWDDVVASYPTFATVYVSRPGLVPMTTAPHLLPPLLGTQFGNSPVIDADADGDKDIVANFGALGCQFWENTGTGFVVVPGVLPPIVGVTYVIDYDRDGDLDFFGGVTGGTGQMYMSSTVREIVKLNEPVRGGTFQADVYSLANHVMVVGVSTNYLRQPFGSLGLLYLDPSQTALLATMTYATRGAQGVGLPIPNLPALVGQLVCIQALDVDLATGAMRLSNAVTGVVQ